MGLISKIRNVGIVTKQRAASSVGALRASSPLAGKVLGASGKVVGFVGKKLIPKTPVGRVLVGGYLAFKGAKYLRGKLKGKKSVAQEGLQANPSNLAGAGGFIGKVSSTARAHPVATAAALATGAYLAEQLAEKAGVRGGAGFFGKRKRKSSRKKTKASRRSRRTTRRISSSRSRGRVSFTTKDGRKVSFTPRKGGRKRRHTRRGWRQDQQRVSQEPHEQRYRRRR